MGAGSALRSGTFQALAYEELDRLGAAASYARVIGRAEAVATGAQLLATLLAAPVLAAGGNTAAGVASVAVCLVGAAVGWSLPESRGAGEREGAGFAAVLREGVAEVRATPGVRGSLLLVAVLMGATALDEFVPLLAEATGAAPSVVPLLVLVVTAGFAVGGWLAGRGTRWAGPALMGGAGLLAVGAPVAVGEGWWGGTVAAGTEAAPWIGMVLIAAAFGVFQWAITAADARLQARIADRSRATITSMAGFGAEVVGVLAFAAYGLGSGLAGPGTLFALAAVPYAVVAVVLWRGR
ncbi:MFS transporter [Thermocatellispora tengchongensis]|uniref:MFS transporter n=1 Tax=Thermocatellispora tengchongensis TaxID=1073253 RepID=UPI0036420598